MCMYTLKELIVDNTFYKKITLSRRFQSQIGWIFWSSVLSSLWQQLFWPNLFGKTASQNYSARLVCH